MHSSFFLQKPSVSLMLQFLPFFPPKPKADLKAFPTFSPVVSLSGFSASSGTDHASEISSSGHLPAWHETPSRQRSTQGFSGEK